MPRKPSQTLEQFNPELADQLVDQSLRSIARGSDKKVQWRCPIDSRHVWWASPMNRTNAKNPTGCSVCNGKTVIPGVNDVATTHPKAAALMVDKKLRTKLTGSSNKKVEFWCGNPKHDHWTAPLSNVARQGTRCPQCSGRRPVFGKSDLATTHPKLAAELVDQSLATTLKPGSNTSVLWQCPANPKHTWKATPYSRTAKKTGCPYCSGRKIVPGVNDLATTHPDLAVQLVDQSLTTVVSKGGSEPVLWQCQVNPEHTWFAAPSNRVKPSGCPICYRLHANPSQTLLTEMVRKLVPTSTVLGDDHTVLPSGKELDIVVPDHHVAIEFNGVFWHSEAATVEAHSRTLPHDYHASKTREASSQGYQLVHVWEDDWLHRRDLVLRALAHRLHAVDLLPDVLPDINPLACQRLYARNLTARRVHGGIARRFWQDNHLQGPVHCTLNVGLYDQGGVLRALLGIGRKNHGSRVSLPDGTWDIQRYATLGVIVGGFTKLLAHAETLVPVDTWTSWSDNDISDGGMYQAAGFTVDKRQAPSYSYVGRRTKWERVHRSTYTKQRFINDPDLTYQSGQTEHDAALTNKLYRIYDAGKTRWVKTVAR